VQARGPGDSLPEKHRSKGGKIGLLRTCIEIKVIPESALTPFKKGAGGFITGKAPVKGGKNDKISIYSKSSKHSVNVLTPFMTFALHCVLCSAGEGAGGFIAGKAPVKGF